MKQQITENEENLLFGKNAKVSVVTLMKVESIAECSLGAFCSTFDLHLAIIGL